MRLPADGDDVDAPVAVEIGAHQVLHRHAAVVDDLAAPFRALVVRRLVDAHAAARGEFVALLRLVAHADDQLVIAVAVEVGAEDGVAPAQLFVDDMAVPHRALRGRFGVDDDLVAVPGLDGGDEAFAVLELALFDLAGAAVALEVGLIARAQVRALPFAALQRQELDAFVAGDEDVLALAAR